MNDRQASPPPPPASVGDSASPGDRKRILRERARALAQEPAQEESSQRCIEVLEFVLAYERYAVETYHVREVYPLKELTPVPCTPAFVLGIINVRGQILSVLDIKKFFDLPEKGITDLNKVILLHTQDMEFGILADVIVGIRSLPVAELQSYLPTLTGIRAEYLKGITGDRLVVLDGQKLLSAREIIVREEVEV
jgi:purine-binding chemotaxis protein CheW